MPEAPSLVKKSKQVTPPAGSEVINEVVVYYFCTEIIQKYDFLKKANEALTLAVELLSLRESEAQITDEQYFNLQTLIKDIKADHLVETGILPMNAQATKKYQTVIKQLEWTLKAIF
jgi:hypothetical protein